MLEIILFLYGIGKQLAVEWDVLKGLTEPTDASSSQHTIIVPRMEERKSILRVASGTIWRKFIACFCA
jgi:hypothetical protein